MTSIQHNHINFTDKRRHSRHECNILGVVKLGSTQITDCIIKDISIGGAKIVISSGNWLPSRFSLDFSDGRPAVDAEIVWANNKSTGVKFAS